MAIKRPKSLILQENLFNAQSAARETRYPVCERSRLTAQWDQELSDHYQWMAGYVKGEKRKDALIRLLGGNLTGMELFNQLNSQIGKTCIYDKIFDARKRPDYNTAEAVVACFTGYTGIRQDLLRILGWYDVQDGDVCFDRVALMDDARRQEHWMGECGKSLENITECLMLARGTMEKLRKNGEYIDSYTAFRVIITLFGCKSAQKYGDDLYHFFGLQALEDGESDRIANICARAYTNLMDDLQAQSKKSDCIGKSEIVAHEIFWGMMYTCLKKNDKLFRKSFSNAFFSKKDMEGLVLKTLNTTGA